MFPIRVQRFSVRPPSTIPGGGPTPVPLSVGPRPRRPYASRVAEIAESRRPAPSIPVRAESDAAGPASIEPALDAHSKETGNSSLDLTLWDQNEAVRAAANRELHPHLLNLSSERLGATYGASAVVLGVYLVALFALSRVTPALAAGFRAGLLPLVIALALSLAMFGVSRIPKLKHEAAYEMG